MSAKVKIVFDSHAGLTKFYNAETDDEIFGVSACTLSFVAGGRCEATLIVDEPLLEGELVATVKEQMVLSDAFMALLAERVAGKIASEIRGVKHAK